MKKTNKEYYNIEYQNRKNQKKTALIRFHIYHLRLMEKYQTTNVYSIIIYTEKTNKNTHYK